MHTPPTKPWTPSPEQLALAIAHAREQGSTRDGALVTQLAETLGAPPQAWAAALLAQQGVALIDDDVLAKAQIVPVAGCPAAACVSLDADRLLLFDDPWSSEATHSLQRSADPRARLALAGPGQLHVAHGRMRGQGEGTHRVHEVQTDGRSAGSESPVVAFVEAAIERAYADGASDIHFERDRHDIGVKYRLDGVMAVGPRLSDPQRAEEVISRIKVLAQLDITERRRPQDGRIHWRSATSGDAMDLRVSIMPSIFGEDAVLRLLDKAQLRHSQRPMSLELLGFDATTADPIRELATRPHGLLLVTGPTGSGKTTTVYAALSETNNGLEKIITVEDPVEYELQGVLQIPVNEHKGLTFASGLRSILRHDPDKILVGEIRDAETAQIAVQSSLTGHLVFTTVHANSLFDVLGRFRHFGIEAFALASALNGVVVQRLLRQVCPQCLQWRGPSADESRRLQALGLSTPVRVPAPTGCPHCRGTGYKGRLVVAEVHAIGDRVRDLMMTGAPMSVFKPAAYPDPSQGLLARAVRLAGLGRTSLEEVARVVGLV